ncbi:hypothetical protein [Tritonibacter scottomollicae]|uniref:hypothetical protein n=1 Tax=Tritonibacter scottomollicae TaxID=483013 RepID=UPI003AA997EB
MATTEHQHHVIHADLSHAHAGEDHWLHAAGRSYELVPHDDASRAEARKAAPHLLSVDDHTLTHFTSEPVMLPRNQVVRVHIKHSLNTFDVADDASHGSTHSGIVQPPAGGDPEAPVHHHINWTSTAAALIFHHPDLITHDPDVAAIVMAFMTDQQNSKRIVGMVSDLATAMSHAGPPTPEGVTPEGWAVLKPMKVTTSNGTSTHYQQVPTQTIIDAAGDVMTAMMIATKNDPKLEGKKWQQQTGDSVQSGSGGAGANLSDTSQPAAQELMTLRAGGSGDNWSAALTISGEQHGLQTSLSIKDASTRTINVKMDNTFIRYLGAYIAFYDADDNLIDISDWDFDCGIPGISAFENKNYRCLGLISAVNNFMAIPITADPGQLNYGDGVDITFPSAQATSAKIFGVGLGTGDIPYGNAIVPGGVMTGFVNLAIPAFLMGFAVAAQSYKPLYKIMEDKKVIAAAVAAGAGFFGVQFGTSAAHHKMNWTALTSLCSILFNQGLTKALAWCEATIVEGEIEDEIPFSGWLVVALNIATGVAQLAETIVEVATSPWFITNTVTEQITSTITVHPDPRHQAWPQGQAGTKSRCEAKMIFKNQGRPTVSQVFEIPANFTDAQIQFAFDGNTLGGEVKIEADFYIDSWLAGKAQSGWLKNEEDITADMTLYLVQLPIPITASSTFKHSAILTYENEAYSWNDTATAPVSTLADLSTSSNANEISECVALALSQRYAVLGQSFKAAGTGLAPATGGGFDTQLFAFQSQNIPGRPMSDVKWMTAGFTYQSELIYDPFPPKFLMKDGQWVLENDRPVPDPEDVDLGCYYVDPRLQDVSLDEGGGFHLRKVDVSGTSDFAPGTLPDPNLLSHGRFPFFPDHTAMHPSGHLIAVNQQAAKVMILNIDQAGKSDADMPVANTNAGKALIADREGFLFRPVALGCSYDGTLLILDQVFSQETSESRVQAFDLLGRPVPCFLDDKGEATSILPIPNDGEVYLDMCVVGNKSMTYIFILYYTGNGKSPTDYNVAIYGFGEKAKSSEMTPIVTTNKVPAARIAVDMWHTLYTLNYQMVADTAGKASGPVTSHAGPAGRTVLSISEWLLPVPGQT